MEVFIDDAALFFLGRHEMYFTKVLGLMGGVMGRFSSSRKLKNALQCPSLALTVEWDQFI